MKYRLFLIIVLVFQFCPAASWASEFHLVPSISLKEDYSSNIFFSGDPGVEAKSDFITTMMFGINMVDRTERSELDVTARWDRREYADNSNLSATNQYYDGKFRYDITPLLSMSAGASYIKNFNNALDLPAGIALSPGTIILFPPPQPPQPPQPPGPFIPAAQIPLVAVQWNYVSSYLSTDYKFNEKANGTLTYRYDRDYYNNRRFQDDTAHNINAKLIYDLSEYLPMVQGRLNAGYSYYKFPDSRNQVFRWTAGFSRSLNEIWSISADVGVRETHSDIVVTKTVPYGDIGTIVVRENLTSDIWSWVSHIDLSYQGQYTSGTLTYRKDFLVASGLNGAAETDAVNLFLQHRLTSELSTLFTAGYQFYTADTSNSSANVIRQQGLSLSTGVRYEFPYFAGPSHAFVDVSYGYDRINNTASDKKADRHLVSVQLYFDCPFLE